MEENKALTKTILKFISDSDIKLTPAAIANKVYTELSVNKKTTRKTITRLVSKGELAYTYTYGSSYLEKSFNRPVKISKSVIVKPFNLAYKSEPSDIVINIFPGISFGSGEHPTTRLSVFAIEYILSEIKIIKDLHNATVLDIGTGSGILAITALMFGLKSGIGVDTDACSRSEAKKNIRINGFEKKIKIIKNLEKMNEKFSLITANLRYPDIISLYPVIHKCSDSNSAVVISGLRPEETGAVIDLYTEKYFKFLLKTTEKKWSCLIFKKI